MTIRLNSAAARPPHAVATDIVARAHAVGLLAATVYPMAQPDEPGEAAHRTISLLDERALTVTIIDTDEKSSLHLIYDSRPMCLTDALSSQSSSELLCFVVDLQEYGVSCHC